MCMGYYCWLDFWYGIWMGARDDCAWRLGAWRRLGVRDDCARRLGARDGFLSPSLWMVWCYYVVEVVVGVTWE